MMGLGGVLALVGKGWHRRLLCSGVLLTVLALGAFILLCTLRGVVAGMPPLGFWLVVTLPHGLGLMATLTGGIFWTIESLPGAHAMIMPPSHGFYGAPRVFVELRRFLAWNRSTGCRQSTPVSPAPVAPWRYLIPGLAPSLDPEAKPARRIRGF